MNYYRLPRDLKIQKEYEKLFKTKGFNWKKGHICCEHWTTKQRDSPDHLPDVIVPDGQLQKIKEFVERAKLRNLKKPCSKNKKNLVLANRKLSAAMSILNGGKNFKRRLLPKLSPPKRKVQRKAKVNLNLTMEDLQKENECLKSELSLTKKSLKEKTELLMKRQNELLLLEGRFEVLKNVEFSYESIRKNEKKFQYLCGLSIEQFDMLFECIQPYLSLLPHSSILFSKQTQYLAVLTVCRHALDYKFMAVLLNTSEATMSRMGNSWIVFLSTIFEEVNIQPNHGYLVEKMPKSFIDTGHGLTDLVLDATEFKFHTATNYDVNSLMFSNYKNHSTGKALIGITPHGMGLLFSDVYPGSVSDTEITTKTNVIDFLFEGHELMTDRGFSVQDYCAEKGITLNRPKQKDNPQFSEMEDERNFNIACTRIHVERYIGRVRDWRILNAVWPLNRCDLLTCVWKMLCHTVNLTCPPIGPKE